MLEEAQPTPQEPVGGPGLHRVLSERHITMLAIGGAIGSGLFLTSGKLISMAGPIGALSAYGICGILVYFLMHSLGELSAKFPSAGGFSFHGSRFVDAGFGFAMGWNYWVNWAITVSLDILSACILVQYWYPGLSMLSCSILFFLLILGLNLISVKGFCEAEYGAAFFKVFAIVLFLLLGFSLIGYDVVAGRGVTETFANWRCGSFSLIQSLILFSRTLMLAAFAFQGSELIGVTAGESKNPEKTLPIAVRQIFVRILFFYVFSTFIIGTLISPSDPLLLKEELTDVAVSPFTLIFERAVGTLAAHLMNLIVLSAVLSSANSGLYASARSLYGLALQGMAPRCFAQTNRSGIPLLAILATAGVSGGCFLLGYTDFWDLYTILIEASSIAGFLAWFGIVLAHYRFRKGWLKQGHLLEELPFVAKFFPWGPLCVIGLSVFVLVGSGVELWLGHSGLCKFLVKYLSLILFMTLWSAYRWFKGEKLVIYEEMNFSQEIF